MAYRGFLAPGVKMEIGAPSPRCVRLASVEGALPHYWGSGAEPQPPTLLGAFGCKWNPFLNSVNTIFNSACQTGKHRRRSPSLLGGSGAEPQLPTILNSQFSILKRAANNSLPNRRCEFWVQKACSHKTYNTYLSL